MTKNGRMKQNPQKGKRMAVNVREIAKKANVSAATVSRVLHQSEQVKPETRKKVEEAMRQLQVTAGELVRSARMDTRIVGILVPDLSNSFFSECILGIEEYAREAGLTTIICHTKESDQEEVRYLRMLKEMHVCGIIMTPTSDDNDYMNNEYLNLLIDMKIPVVLLDRDVKYSQLDGVFIDNENGAFNAVKLLLENGHRNIAMISGPLNTVPGRGREEGYRNAFEFMNVPLREELIYEGHFSIQGGREATEMILREHPEVTAIFSSNNHMTIGCLSRLFEEGLKIPDDMAVIGFDDIPILNQLGYEITVVGRPTKEMGHQAVKILAKMMNGKRTDMTRRIILIPKLIIRGSERLCRPAD